MFNWQMRVVLNSNLMQDLHWRTHVVKVTSPFGLADTWIQGSTPSMSQQPNCSFQSMYLDPISLAVLALPIELYTHPHFPCVTTTATCRALFKIFQGCYAISIAWWNDGQIQLRIQQFLLHDGMMAAKPKEPEERLETQNGSENIISIWNKHKSRNWSASQKLRTSNTNFKH